MWRLDPNTGKELINFNDVEFTNVALKKYFENSPMVYNVNGKRISIYFQGFHPKRLNKCLLHGGECMFISAMQTAFDREITDAEIESYIKEYFKWEYMEMFKEKWFG
jgi:hypothetical protein